MTPRLFILLWSLAAASPASAGPLTFGAVGADKDLSQDLELARCETGREGKVCSLRRTTFGGLPIQRSELLLNDRGRPISLDLLLDRSDHGTAYQMLVGRYGPASRVGSAARWRGFDQGAGIAIEPRGRFSAVSFSFPANVAGSDRTAIDERLIWSLVLFSVLGIVAGSAIHRVRRRRRKVSVSHHEPGPPISMREALERRVQEGRDWHL